ncbi:MAG: T9SS type A sorting domain-containing protein [Flavobacteriaceae bacterium]
MKQTYFLKLLSILFVSILNSTSINSQTQGDIAFISFNADGDDDFSIVALADISANSTLFITDNESDGLGGITSGEGILTWVSGSQIINAGTVITFTDVDNESNPSFGVSIGSLSSSGSFNISPSSKDGLITYTGVDSSSPTTFIAALQIGNDASTLGPFDGDGITLTNTSLVIGTSIIVIDSSASPDGATYHASRSSETSFDNYYTLLVDDATNWTNIVNGDGETLLPFSQEAFTINTTTWTGSTNNIWNLATNWDNGVPSHSSSVLIPDVANSPIISSGTEAKAGNVTISSGEVLTINNSNSLTVSGQLTISGSFIMNSGSSLITKGTSTGNITYHRNLETSNWYLVSSPVIDQDVDDFVTAESLQQNLPNIALGTYNTVDDTWSYYQNGTSNSDTFNSGQGHSINLDGSSGDISFTGTLNTSDASISLSTTGNGFNLLGNPYPSYVNSASLLTENTTSLLTETLWIWDQSTGNYTTKVAIDNFQLAPGQGFFVQSNGALGNVFINESFQNHQSTDTFIKSTTNRPEIYLTLTEQTNEVKTKIYYIDGTTTGFDNGYDGPIFGGAASTFSIYTNSIVNDQGRNLAIQSLPNNNFENMIIPIGIDATSGTEITLSASATNLPTGINIYLEDRQNNSFTLLNGSSNFTTIFNNDISGAGRFYLHTTTSTLTTDSINFTIDPIKIYTYDKRYLRIVGIQKEAAEVKVFDILGKQIMLSSFEGNGVNDFLLPKLRPGIYSIQLNTNRGRLNKKLILNQ